jgi:hypothetical protein
MTEQPRGKNARIVRDEKVARLQETGKIANVSMRESPRCAVHHEHP